MLKLWKGLFYCTFSSFSALLSSVVTHGSVIGAASAWPRCASSSNKTESWVQGLIRYQNVLEEGARGVGQIFTTWNFRLGKWELFLGWMKGMGNLRTVRDLGALRQITNKIKSWLYSQNILGGSGVWGGILPH